MSKVRNLTMEQELALGQVHIELGHGGWAQCPCALAQALREGTGQSQ